LQFAAHIHVVVAHIEAAIKSGQCDEVAVSDAAACIIGGHDVASLVIMKARFARNFTVRRVLDSTKNFTLVVYHRGNNRFLI
jgi:hypothetical protein